MERSIKKAVVLGSGVMGAGIAAHLANVGVPVTMLDIVPKELTEEEKKKGLTLESPEVRNRIAANGKARLLKEKPAPLYEKSNLNLISVGNFEDDRDKLGDADWIIEVVVENLDIKKKVFEMVDEHRKPGTIVSSNTSGVSINAMAEGRSEDFRKHFLGTHFFNPPRYLKLLEIIPSDDTLPEITQFMLEFGEKKLGKGTVLCKDTPNFIANRIGIYGLQVTVQEMMRLGLRVDEVDSATGPAIGRPKSATFRTLDVVGLDTYVHVANNVREQVNDPEEKAVFEIPAFIEKMVENKWLGSKTGQGFYKKEKTPEGKQILTLDYNTLEYVPRKKLKAPSLEAAKSAKGWDKKLQSIVYAKDKAGELTWNIMKKVLLYSAAKIPEIADDIVSVDNAMKWGFGWELGPFEIWDAIGVEKSVARMKEEGEKIPPLVEELLASGKKTFYQKEEGARRFFVGGAYKDLEEKPEIIDLARLKEQNRVIKKNSGASLIDIGDDVALLEFHSPNNAIGVDILQMLDYAVDEVDQNYRGLVIGNQGKNFCVGANIMFMLMEAQDENWFEIEMVAKKFQGIMSKVKYSRKPVVAAPFAMTLGGGVEVCFPADRVQTAAETYMGLVEVGVGLIPGGGGTKEMLLRHLEGVPQGTDVDLQPFVAKAFETIAMAKVSTSGPEAKKYNYLRDHDRISINQDYLLYDAKQQVLSLADNNYRPQQPKNVKVIGETGRAALKLAAQTMYWGGQISEHDLKIADKLAFVLSGGNVPAGTEVSEQYLLDLEREAFLSLLGEPKTQQRMQHMIAKGKPLRN
ncbi:MAG: enoyl-CoA hydratase/isomerase family protein [Bacillaceae bacterium]|nr:enoyl-CoA hydratase/isomerase family protein [Bacillaceae bacterium]